MQNDVERLQLIMRRVFGVRHGGLYFATILVLEDNCFYYRNKRYAWEDIAAIKRGDELPATFMRYPSTTILLSDGIVLRIPVILQEMGVHYSIRFEPFQHKTKSYDELMAILERNSVTRSETLSQRLYSWNYIMIYRWLIIVGFAFGLFILFALFRLEVKYDFVMVFITVLQVMSMGAGIFLLATRHLNESRTRKELKKHLLVKEDTHPDNRVG